MTRLVGMYLPGLHSLFSTFDVRIDPTGGDLGSMHYETRRFDDRFSLATIDVAGSAVGGSVTAFVRAPPIEPTVGEVRAEATEFVGQRWLIVGGSRGLGAIAAMLLVGGGADVRITYRIGIDDATRFAAQIGAQAHQVDVTAPDAAVAAILADGWQPTHLGYFASPPIFDGTGGTYSERLEHRFAAIYIDGFGALVDRLDVARLRGILWPSSTVLDADVPGLAEYASVKRRGEAFCAELGRRHDHLVIATPRFPRLRTDQSSSFVPVEFGDAPATVLTALRTFSG